MAQKGQLAMTRISRELGELTAIRQIGEGSDPFIIYERVQALNGIPTRRIFAIHFNSADHAVRLYTDLDSGIATLDADQIGNGDILVDGVSSFNLAYYQGANTLAWQFDLQLLSTIAITLDLTRPDAPDHSQHFATLVQMRNTDNLGGAAP